MKKKLALLFIALCSTTCFGQNLYNYYFSNAAEQLESRNYDKAAYFLDKGINMYPDSVNLYIIRAYNRHYQELPDSSIADLKRAKELGSNNALITMFLGLNYQDISEFELATVHYKEYLEIVPEDSNIVISLVTLLVDQGELSEAEQYALDYKEAYQNSYSSSMLLGLINHGRGSYQKAIEHFTDYIKRCNSRDPYGYLHRSYSYKGLVSGNNAQCR